MPDFTVIEGGGKPQNYEADAARQAFERLVIEILRALARGDNSCARVVDELFSFLDHANTAKAPVGPLVERALSNLREDSLPESEAWDDPEAPMAEIARHGLRYLAESMARDPAARGRRGSRRQDLVQRIEHYVIGREEAARKNGNWSYLAKLSESVDVRVGKFKPVKPWAAKTRPRRGGPDIEL